MSHVPGQPITLHANGLLAINGGGVYQPDPTVVKADVFIRRDAETAYALVPAAEITIVVAGTDVYVTLSGTVATAVSRFDVRLVDQTDPQEWGQTDWSVEIETLPAKVKTALEVADGMLDKAVKSDDTLDLVKDDQPAGRISSTRVTA